LGTWRDAFPFWQGSGFGEEPSHSIWIPILSEPPVEKTPIPDLRTGLLMEAIRLQLVFTALVAIACYRVAIDLVKSSLLRKLPQG
jgi:hypothetical protein